MFIHAHESYLCVIKIVNLWKLLLYLGYLHNLLDITYSYNRKSCTVLDLRVDVLVLTVL